MWRKIAVPCALFFRHRLAVKAGKDVHLLSISLSISHNTHPQYMHSVDFQIFTYFLKFRKLYFTNNQLVPG
jgi:hypothetical protein